MDLKKIKEEHSKIIEKLGGYAAVQRKLLLQKVYMSLYFRTDRNSETISISKGEQFLMFNYSVDLYTESGISKLRIPAQSCFELKDTIVSDSIYRIKRFSTLYLEKHPGAKVYFLYQNPGVMTDKTLNESKKLKLFEIYQVDDFLAKIDKVAKVQDQIEKQEYDWKAERESIIESAKFSYREDHCSFFLGAGVSMDAGGPSWEILLQQIMKKIKNIGRRNEFKKVYESCGNSPIILGRYLASNDKKLEWISEYLRECVLYRNVHLEKSELIKAICEAIIGSEKDERIIAVGSVESIITYNYDDLVETALEKEGFQTARVYQKSRIKRGEFPVYHVHGIIPQEKNGIISTPIFGEKEYHQVYRESYQWSNVEQLHALDRNTCFFIGMSMTDPNLRRLLDISRAGSDNDSRHYAFLERKPLFKLEEVQKNELHFKTIEFQLYDLGVQVIWYEKYNEVPKFIRRIIAPLRFVR